MWKTLLALGVVLGMAAPVSTEAGAGSLVMGAPMTAARAAHSATLLSNGTVLVAGGMVVERQILSSAEIYDPAAARFVPTGSMQTARVSHTATLLAGGQVLVAGGWGDQGVLSSAEVYDAAGETFVETGAMLTPRGGHTATLLLDGRVLVTGGSDGQQTLAQAELYDPQTRSFAAAGEMQAAREAHSATRLLDGRVLIVGGNRDETVLSSAEVYDPVTGRFVLVGAMAVERHKHAATLLGDGRVMIIGGSDARDWGGQYTSTEIFDPVTGTFTAAASMAAQRFKLPEAAAVLDTGLVLVAGGSQTVELYDPVSDRFGTVSGEIDADRFFSTVTVLPDGTALIAGGYDSDIAGTSATWLFRATGDRPASD